MSELLSKMAIDEEKVLCPFAPRKKGNQVKQQFSDHNAMIATFNINESWVVERNEVNEGLKGWKITGDGITRFKEITSGPLNKAETYDEMKNQLNNTLNVCFAVKKTQRMIVNTKRVRGHHYTKIIDSIKQISRKGREEKHAGQKYLQFIQDIQMEKVQQLRTNRISDQLLSLQDDSKSFSHDKFWKIKKKISKKKDDKSSIISKAGVELLSDTAIIKEYENEFCERLTHRQIDQSLTRYEELSHQLLSCYLSVTSQMKEEPDFSVDEVTKQIQTLQNGKVCGPDLFPPEAFINSGISLLTNLTKILNRIKNRLEIPEDWFDTTISTIFKNKGSRKQLKNYRGIFITSVISKILEKLVKSRIEVYTAKVSKLQAGSRKGRSTCDNTFLLRGVIDHSLYLNSSLYLTMYDYTTCFDSLWLEDCLLTLWKLGVRNEMLSLIYKLNEKANIRIKTPYGMSSTFTSHNIVKQGTVLGPLLCSSSTAEICEEKDFGGVSMGSLKLSCLLFVDDSTDLNTNINDSSASHEKFMQFVRRKRLTLNQTKCVQMIINGRSNEVTPTLRIGDNKVSHVKYSKVLGDIVSDSGFNLELIKDRVKKGDAVTVNTFALCNEITLGQHQIRVAKLMYKTVFLPAVLFNAQAWSKLTNTDTRNLEIVQLRFLKRMLQTPVSTPNVCVFLELGILPMKYEIHIRKLSFLHHVIHLPDNDPVKQMFFEQLSLPYENNWGNEVVNLLKSYALARDKTDWSIIYQKSKGEWKRAVQRAVSRDAFEALQYESKIKVKSRDLVYDKFITKAYFLECPTEVACFMFKARSKSLNCKANRHSANPNTTCRLCCLSEEDQTHLINCPKVLSEDEETLSLDDIVGKDIVINVNKVQLMINRVKKFAELASKNIETEK